jgi:FKBP-type peptidyl-prolyl cis-trans isomerase FklB
MRNYLPVIGLAGMLCLILAVSAQQPLPQPQVARPAAAPAASSAQLSATARQQVSYVLGQNFAANLRANEIECDLEFLFAGISDVIKNAPPRWTEEQLQPVMQQFGQQMEQKAAARFERQAQANQQQAARFLAENAKREGVQTTPSGLQYRVVQQGNGASPTLKDKVRCHYRGTLLDGTEFDSTTGGQPAEFPVDGVIAGWTEALQKMRAGDKWQLFIPADLAYRMSPPPGSGIEPGSMLIFDIELIEVIPQ